MILVVDDDRSITDWQVEFLKLSGFDALPAYSAEEALSALHFARESVRCIVSDVTLPNESGVWLARQVAATAPEIPVILCTGYDHVLSPSPNVPTVLIKPFGPMLLLKAIRDAIASGTKTLPASA